jgi:streptogramin lyase
MKRGIAGAVARGTTTAGALAALALGTSSIASAAPSITEFLAGNSTYSEPLSIVTAPTSGEPAGDLWFTVNGSPAGFGIMSSTGNLTKVGEPLGNPREVTIGPEGDLWVVENGDHPRIEWGNTASSQYVASGEISLPTGSDPTGIAAGPGGDMWITEGDGTGQIVRVDPSTEKITGEFSTGLTDGGEPAQIVEGSDGNMWFAEYGGSGAIGRITPTGQITEFTAGLTTDSKPWGVALGAEGNVWFTEFSPAGKVGRITPSGQITEFGEGLTKGEPGEIVAGDNGNLYFTERGGEGAVGEITPEGKITEFTSGLTIDNAPWSITPGPDGNMWFTELEESKIATLTIAPGIALTSAHTPSTSAVTLESSILPNSQASTLSFEYGATGAYGSLSSSTSAGEGAGVMTRAISLSGLAPGTTYHYRAVAANTSGTTYGPDATFTTTTTPPAGEAPTGETPPVDTPPAVTSGQSVASTPITPILIPVEPSSPAPAAPPSIGHSAVAGVMSGVVLVDNPHSGRPEPLGSAANIPVGSIVDATHGVVSLTTALGGGRVQSATLWGGVFQFRQSGRGNGMTDIYLRGPLGPCPARGHLAQAHAARSHESAKRELWSKDSHGHYTTHGADSAATVLGTEWQTVDSCDGTLTHVRRGRVRVRDLHNHHTVVVRAGQSYLARG